MKRGDTVRYETKVGAVAAWIVTPPFDTDRAVIRMVGDDRDFEVDVSDVEPIDEDEFCGGCGQIGCGHG